MTTIKKLFKKKALGRCWECIFIINLILCVCVCVCVCVVFSTLLPNFLSLALDFELNKGMNYSVYFCSLVSLKLSLKQGEKRILVEYIMNLCSKLSFDLCHHQK